MATLIHMYFDGKQTDAVAADIAVDTVRRIGFADRIVARLDCIPTENSPRCYCGHVQVIAARQDRGFLCDLPHYGQVWVSPRSIASLAF